MFNKNRNTRLYNIHKYDLKQLFENIIWLINR